MNSLHQTHSKEVDSFNAHEKLSKYRSRRKQGLQKRTHFCDFCKKQFPSEYNLKRHITIHAQKKHYCNICQKNFSSYSYLQKHLKRHVIVKMHSCSGCQKLFAFFSECKHHSIFHTADTPHFCNVCQQQFFSSESLLEHIIKKECGTYLCSFCKEQSISRKDSCIEKKVDSLLPDKRLEEEKLQTEEKHNTMHDEKLSKDNRSFSQEKHDNLLIGKDDKKLFCCKICKKNFTNKAQLDRHTCTSSSNVYAKWLAFRCGKTKCNSNSNSTTKCNSNSNFTTNRRRELYCKLCQQYFYSEGFLKRHYLAHSNHRSGQRMLNLLHPIHETINIIYLHSANKNQFCSNLNEKKHEESCSEKKITSILTSEASEKEESYIGEVLCDKQIKNEPKDDLYTKKEYFIPTKKETEEDKFFDVLIKNEPEDDESCTEEEFQFVLTKKISEGEGAHIENHNILIKNEPKEEIMQ